MLLLFFTKQELGTISKISFMEGGIQCTPDTMHILRSTVQWVLTAIHTKRRPNTAITPRSFFLFHCCSFFPLPLPCHAMLSRFSPVRLCDPMDCSPSNSSVGGILQARILEWVDIPSPKGIFPTQGSNPGLLYCRWILCHLSHEEAQDR